MNETTTESDRTFLDELTATHCLCCGRPLTDAESVERGIGPDCCKKHGYSKCDAEADFKSAASEAVLAGCFGMIEAFLARRDARQACNIVVKLVAAQPGHALQIHRIDLIRALGFHKLALKVEEHHFDERGVVTIRTEGDALVVDVKQMSGAKFLRFLAAMRSVPGRRFEAARRVNVVPVSEREVMMRELRELLAGCRVVDNDVESFLRPLVAA